MSTTGRSEPWHDTEHAAMGLLALQLEAVCERLHADKYASLDDFADQLEATADRMPWQSNHRSTVEKAASAARNGRGELSHWVQLWRAVDSCVQIYVITRPAPAPAPAAAAVAGPLEWRKIDGELRLVEPPEVREALSNPAVTATTSEKVAPARRETAAERTPDWIVECDRVFAITHGPGGLGTVDLPNGVYGALHTAGVFTIAELERRIADGSVASVKGLGPSRCSALARWGRGS